MKVDLKSAGTLAHQTQNVVLAAFVAATIILLALVGVLLMKHGTMSTMSGGSPPVKLVIDVVKTDKIESVETPRGVEQTSSVVEGSGVISIKPKPRFNPK